MKGGDERIQQWTNYSTMVQQEYCTSGGLTAETLIANDPSGNLFERQIL